jgi:hypothetical protein
MFASLQSILFLKALYVSAMADLMIGISSGDMALSHLYFCIS